MARTKRPGTDLSDSAASASGSGLTRDAKTGRFLVGRDAFARISAVEGIRVSEGLASDLRALQDASSAKRRSMLTGKYGKRE